MDVFYKYICMNDNIFKDCVINKILICYWWLLIYFILYYFCIIDNMFKCLVIYVFLENFDNVISYIKY